MMASKLNQRKDCLVILTTKSHKNPQILFLNKQKVKRGCLETLTKSKNLKNSPLLQKFLQNRHKTKRDYSEVLMTKMIRSRRKQLRNHNLLNLNKRQFKVNQSFKQKKLRAYLQVHWRQHKNPYPQAPWQEALNL